MAKCTTASKPARQLGKLLQRQQQQEPLTLQVYLSDKGCGTNNLTSDPNSILTSPMVLKPLLCTLLMKIKGLRTKNSHDEQEGNKQETAEVNRFSSSCSCSAPYSDTEESSMFTDDSNSLKLYTETGDKAAIDAKFEWSRTSTCMEHNPQSVVLEEITISDTGKESFISSKPMTEESILSAALCNLLHQRTQKHQSSCEGGLTDSEPLCNATSPYSMPKTKQLLLDCVRELVDDHNNNNEGMWKGKRYLGCEEIGSVMCERIRDWGNRCGDETNIKEMDVLKQQEWNDFEIESCRKREIGLLLGNAVLEELTSEVVMDMSI